MTHNKNNTPPAPVVEEIIIEEEQTEQKVIQEILNKFKQPIPVNFVELKVEEGNYMGFTNPKWKDKPACERYGFFYSEERKWTQIDIPHELMEALEITEGEDITYPLYLSSDTLKKELIRGAITIENEEELFIDKPASEKSAKKELVKRLEDLEILRKKVEGLKKEKRELQEENKKFRLLSLFRKKKINELKKIEQRNWLGFMDWLDANVVDPTKFKKMMKEMKINRYAFVNFDLVKDEKREKWKEFNIERFNTLYTILHINCRGVEPKYKNFYNLMETTWGSRKNILIHPYEESKELFDLIDENWGKQSWLGDNKVIETMFLQWKVDTPLQNALQ